jgi:XTP/dITP diphosphohydrolase
MNKKLVFATNNKHKLEELTALVSSFEIVGLHNIGCIDDIPETENTLKGNAILKANFVSQNYRVNCFADDTGLEVESLNNAPGVFSARYAGAGCSSEDNIEKLLKNLNNKLNRKAKFKTVIALNLNNEQFLFEGECVGVILKEKRGVQGFGYDSVFMPNGYNKSFAEMTLAEKSAISHRGKAVQKLVAFLNNYTW